jgi:Protein of unknown function (DUF2889)
MSLPAPAPRKHLHTRTITCEGYERDDGLFDIEAQIVDRKTYDVDEPYRGHRPAGAQVHDMQLRLTLDRGMTVRGIDVTTNHAPYDVCPTVAPGYKALVGAKIGAGWRKAVTEAVGRTKGCTHITELLMPAATVAFQTMGSWPKGGEVATEANPGQAAKKPYFIDGCKAWASDGTVVQRLFPLHYRENRGRG